jgi:subtilase family serine protease
MRKASGLMWVLLVVLLVGFVEQALAQAVKPPVTTTKRVTRPPKGVVKLYPDLIIKDFKPDQVMHATVVVLNDGNVDAAACTLNFRIYAGQPIVFEKNYPVPALKTGTSTTIDIVTTVAMGTGGACNCLQRFTVDSKNVVKESNENNNVLTASSYLK